MGATDEPAWPGDLRLQGIDARWVPDGHCWVRFKRVAHQRYPSNDLAPITAAARRDLLWKQRFAVLQYHEPAGDLPANASLYLCRDAGYSLDSLTSNNRSKVRRGLKRLEVRQITVDEVVAHGYESYQDTLDRHGVSLMSPEQFRANWERQMVVPTRQLWGAWAGPALAAFGIVHRCGRWASISATTSSREYQGDYANHALFFTMIEHLMADPEIETVSYGLSSLRRETARDSLHHFKTSVGLEAVPVHRHVVVHPLLRPAINRGSLGAMRLVQRAVPSARAPRAARATLEFLLDDGPADPGTDGPALVEAP